VATFSPSVEVAEGGRGGHARPAGGSGCVLYFSAEGRRKSAGPGGPIGRVG
jgi:hypothetical protein